MKRFEPAGTVDLIEFHSEDDLVYSREIVIESGPVDPNDVLSIEVVAHELTAEGTAADPRRKDV